MRKASWLRRLSGGWAAWFLLAGMAAAGPPTVGVWLATGGPPGIWEKVCGDSFPVARIVGDQAGLGSSEIFFFEQVGRGGPFQHPTHVPHAATDDRMKGRDFLRELLEETSRHNIQVWLVWTTPAGKYPGTDFAGLTDPGIEQIYLREIEEVAAAYGRYGNLAGILWHELDCTETLDSHSNGRSAFTAFCRQSFGADYAGPAAQGRSGRSVVATVLPVQDARGGHVRGANGRGRPPPRPANGLLFLHARSLRRRELAVGLRRRRAGKSVRPAVVLGLYGRVGQALPVDPRGLARLRPQLPRPDPGPQLRLCLSRPAFELLRVPLADLPCRDAGVLLAGQGLHASPRRFLYRFPGHGRRKSSFSRASSAWANGSA